MSTKTPATTECLLTCRDVAEILQLSVQSVHQLVRAGLIPASRIGRSIRVDKRALLEHIAAHPVRPKKRKR
jgi:excisionase family DNA binding protein